MRRDAGVADILSSETTTGLLLASFSSVVRKGID